MIWRLDLRRGSLWLLQLSSVNMAGWGSSVGGDLGSLPLCLAQRYAGEYPLQGDNPKHAVLTLIGRLTRWTRMP